MTDNFMSTIIQANMSATKETDMSVDGKSDLFMTEAQAIAMTQKAIAEYKDLVLRNVMEYKRGHNLCSEGVKSFLNDVEIPFSSRRAFVITLEIEFDSWNPYDDDENTINSLCDNIGGWIDDFIKSEDYDDNISDINTSVCYDG